MKRIALFLLFLSSGLTFAQATPPDAINYQGVLRGSSGEPLDGSYAMVFRFFDDPSAGNEILVDTHAAVTVTGGLFNVEVGGGSVADGSGPGTFSTLADVFGQHTDLYLEVEVAGETLQPRTAVSAAGYALNARKVRGRELVSEGPLQLYVDSSVSGCGGGGCNDVNDGLSSATAKQTIQAAVDAIPAVLNGAVKVNISPGSYIGGITLGRRLRNGPYTVWLEGNDAAPSSVTIQGGGRDGDDTGISVFDDKVVISGVTVSQFGNGIDVAGGFVELTACEISNNGFGVFSHQGAFVDILDCTIRDNFVTVPDPELGYGVAAFEHGTVELGGAVTLTGNGTAAIAVNGSSIFFNVTSCDLTGSGAMETAWHSSIWGYGICTSGLPDRCVYSHNDDTACCSMSENGPCIPFP